MRTERYYNIAANEPLPFVHVEIAPRMRKEQNFVRGTVIL